MAACFKHPFDTASNSCRACGSDFCPDCLVYIQGERKAPTCIDCAMIAAGVRRKPKRRAAFR